MGHVEGKTAQGSKMKNPWRFAVAAMFVPLLVLAAKPGWAGEIKGTVKVEGLRSAENIAVYVEAVPGKNFPAPAKHEVMDQHHLEFVPHVLVVLKGTTVDFLNSDPVGHNIFWPSVARNRKLAHNMGTWPQGVKKAFTFDNLGVVPLLCNVHPEMSGYIIVVPTPYFALTNKGGAFEIKDLPAGHYTLTTWSEEGKPTTQAVDVSGAATTVTLTVKK
jgi:plastocyanin